MSLVDLPVGADAVIERLEVAEDVDLALLRAMGLVEGQPIRILRRAPFGGPLQVRVGEAAFALGRALAHAVLVAAHEPG